MTQTPRHASHGFGVISTLILIGLIAGAATAAFKLGPHYLQFWTVRSVMEDISRDPATAAMGPQGVIQSLEKKLYINDVRSVSRDSFTLEKAQVGRELSVHYEVREHLFGNLDAVLVFSHLSLIP